MESKIVDKIRKLLALAESSNEHEAQLAMQRANELMAKHQIDIASIDLDPSEIKQEHYEVAGQKMKLKWIETLAQACAHMFDGELLVNRRLHGTSFSFVGYQEDIEVMKSLFEHLYTSWFIIVATDLTDAKVEHANTLNEMGAVVDEDGGLRTTKWEPRDTMRFKAGHGVMYAHTIYHRAMGMKKARQEEVVAATGTDLVVVKDAALKEYGEAQGWTMSKSNKASSGSAAGQRAGSAAGRAANLGNSLK